MNRRDFLKAFGASASFMILPRRLVAGSGVPPPSETVYLAAVGVGGQGRSDVNGFLQRKDVKVVALCDVDPRQMAQAMKMVPGAQKFVDYREMYSKIGKSFDAVLVATPDHWHTLPTLDAMRLGKHVYTEKPLARTVVEIETLMKAAKHYNVVTQQGNQGHSFASEQTFKSWVQSGMLGDLKEAHTWVTMQQCDSPRLVDKALAGEKLPDGFDWKRWIGPSEFMPFSQWLAPNRWRAWTPFGTGNPGDWGCHLLDPLYDSLNLTAPVRITAEIRPGWDPVRDRLAFPHGARIRYEYRLTNGQPFIILWHDGDFCNEVPRPPMLEEGRELGNIVKPEWNAGAVVYGSKHTVKYGSHGADGCRVIPETDMRAMVKDVKEAKKSESAFWIKRIGTHIGDFITAIKIGRKANNPFETAGWVAENAALGAIAIQNPGVALEWDAEAQRFKNSDRANGMVDPHYRNGYSIHGSL